MVAVRTACSLPPQDGQTSPQRSPYLSSGTELNHTNLSLCGSYPNGTPRPAHFEAIEPHFMSFFDITYMRRIVRTGRCRCGNRIGSPKDKPALSGTGLTAELEAPSGEHTVDPRRGIVVQGTVAIGKAEVRGVTRVHGASPVMRAERSP